MATLADNPRPAARPSRRVREACGSLEAHLGHALFRALSDPNRIRLVVALASRCRDCSVNELAACLTVDVSVVSRHLAALKAAGVLHAQRRGKEVRYAIRCAELATTLRAIADAIEVCCPPADAPGTCACGPSCGASCAPARPAPPTSTPQTSALARRAPNASARRGQRKGASR